jgi:phosphoserine phosphatase
MAIKQDSLRFYFLENTCKRIRIDYVHANELEIINGKLTGNYFMKL